MHLRARAEAGADRLARPPLNRHYGRQAHVVALRMRPSHVEGVPERARQ
jgi:hypothetical protein